MRRNGSWKSGRLRRAPQVPGRSPCCSGIGNSLMSQEGGEKNDSSASCCNASICYIPRWGENFGLVVFRKLATQIHEKICAIFRRTYCRNVWEYACFHFFVTFCCSRLSVGEESLLFVLFLVLSSLVFLCLLGYLIVKADLQADRSSTQFTLWHMWQVRQHRKCPYCTCDVELVLCKCSSY